MPVGIFMLCFFRTWLSEAYTLSTYLLQSLQRHLSAFQSCIFPVKISNDFAFLISQGLIPILWGHEKICFLFQSTLCSFFAFKELAHFSDCMVSVQIGNYLSQL